MMTSGSDVLLGEAFQLLTKIRSTPRSGGHVLLKKIEVVIHCPLGLLHSLLDSLLRLNVEILQRASVFCHDNSPDHRKKLTNLRLGPLADTAMATRRSFVDPPHIQCPLLGVKRTSHGHAPMSAFDPKRTLPPKIAAAQT